MCKNCMEHIKPVFFVRWLLHEALSFTSISTQMRATRGLRDDAAVRSWMFGLAYMCYIKHTRAPHHCDVIWWHLSRGRHAHHVSTTEYSACLVCTSARPSVSRVDFHTRFQRITHTHTNTHAHTANTIYTRNVSKNSRVLTGVQCVRRPRPPTML